MIDPKRFKSELISLNENTFEKFALQVFNVQWTQNQIYRDYCNLLGITSKEVKTLVDIPFLPITFFKTHEIKTGLWQDQKKFKSSGTTGKRSIHHVKDESLYHEVAKNIFEQNFGELKDKHILALLPSYLEQGDSSLVSMVDYFIKESGHGGFYLDNYNDLKNALTNNPNPKILFGVSYALLDFIDKTGPLINVENLIIIETGGMKGRRKEMIRSELHQMIKSGFHLDDVYSEYGMTELFSQAYGRNGLFSCPKWAKVMIRDINDPFSYVGNETVGGINIIDLANINTISFVETEDLGKITKNGFFEVLGRKDNSDIRGCNLLI
ncbi:MAG: acyl transferase [Bacteroidota bacterium]